MTHFAGFSEYLQYQSYLVFVHIEQQNKKG